MPLATSWRHQLAGGSLAGNDCIPHSSTMSIGDPPESPNLESRRAVVLLGPLAASVRGPFGRGQPAPGAGDDVASVSNKSRPPLPGSGSGARTETWLTVMEGLPFDEKQAGHVGREMRLDP